MANEETKLLIGLDEVFLTDFEILIAASEDFFRRKAYARIVHKSSVVRDYIIFRRCLGFEGIVIEATLGFLKIRKVGNHSTRLTYEYLRSGETLDDRLDDVALKIDVDPNGRPEFHVVENPLEDEIRNLSIGSYSHTLFQEFRKSLFDDTLLSTGETSIMELRTHVGGEMDSEQFLMGLPIYERQIVSLWVSGKSSKEIAKVVDRSPKTVVNIIVNLRKINGPDLVPYKKDLNKH